MGPISLFGVVADRAAPGISSGCGEVRRGARIARVLIVLQGLERRLGFEAHTESFEEVPSPKNAEL